MIKKRGFFIFVYFPVLFLNLRKEKKVERIKLLLHRFSWIVDDVCLSLDDGGSGVIDPFGGYSHRQIKDLLKEIKEVISLIERLEEK